MQKLFIVFVVFFLSSLLACSEAPKITISQNAGNLSAKEIIERNGGAIGYERVPALEKRPVFFAIIRNDSFIPEAYKKNNPAKPITWATGMIPDRIYFVFQDTPIQEKVLRDYM